MGGWIPWGWGPGDGLDGLPGQRGGHGWRLVLGVPHRVPEVLHRVLGVVHRVLGVVHRVLGVVHRVLGPQHRVLGVVHRVLGLQHRVTVSGCTHRGACVRAGGGAREPAGS